MEYLAVHGWGDFQHYKDRNPPWIKVHTSVLDDYTFFQLPTKAKAHLFLLWLLAARTDNKIPYDTSWVANSIRVSKDEFSLEIFLETGWLVPHGEQATGTKREWASRYIPRKVKDAVWERDAGVCQDCGGNEYIEYDHVIPVSRGGTSAQENLQLLCRKCNRKKRSEVPAEQDATQVDSGATHMPSTNRGEITDITERTGSDTGDAF